MVAAVLGVLTVIGLVASVVTLWVRATVLDSEQVGAIIERSLDDPAVTAAVAEELTDTLFEAVDGFDLARGVLPGVFDGLADVVYQRIRSAVEERITAVLSTERAHAVMAASAELGHRQLMRVLLGEGIDGVAVTENEVVLNAVPLVALGLGELQRIGAIDPRIELPTFDPAGDPAAQIAQLGSTVGRELRPDFAQLVIYRSDDFGRLSSTVDRLQRAMARMIRGVNVLVAVSAVLLVATIAVATSRWRAVAWLLAAAAVSFVVVRLAIDPAISLASKAFTTTDDQATIGDVLRDVAAGLVRLLTMLAAGSALASVAGWAISRRAS